MSVKSENLSGAPRLDPTCRPEDGCSMVRLGLTMDRKYRYWGVTCNCGEFQAFKEIKSLRDEQRPQVTSFKFVCTHGEIGASVKEQESHRDKLLREEFEQPIPGFTVHPAFLKP